MQINDLKQKIENKEFEDFLEHTPKDYKMTRRDKREQKKHQKWVDKVSEASGVDFDEVASADLTPQQMKEALLQI